QGRLGLFAKGYWGNPHYKLTPQDKKFLNRQLKRSFKALKPEVDKISSALTAYQEEVDQASAALFFRLMTSMESESQTLLENPALMPESVELASSLLSMGTSGISSEGMAAAGFLDLGGLFSAIGVTGNIASTATNFINDFMSNELADLNSLIDAGQLDAAFQQGVDLVNQYKQDIQALGGQISDIRDQITQLENRISQIQDTLSDLNSQLDDINTLIDTLDKTAPDYQAQLDNLIAQRDELQAQINDRLKDLNELKEAVEDLKNILDTSAVIKKVKEAIGGFLSRFLGPIKSFINKGLKRLPQFLTQVTNIVQNFISGRLQGVFKFISNNFTRIMSILSKLSQIKSILENATPDMVLKLVVSKIRPLISNWWVTNKIMRAKEYLDSIMNKLKKLARRCRTNPFNCRLQPALSYAHVNNGLSRMNMARSNNKGSSKFEKRMFKRVKVKLRQVTKELKLHAKEIIQNRTLRITGNLTLEELRDTALYELSRLETSL
ncbi:MAG: hypothetical protein D6719_13615, partial [Candidatus Dadabacteria bacterium]